MNSYPHFLEVRARPEMAEVADNCRFHRQSRNAADAGQSKKAGGKKTSGRKTV
ncbi:MAG: hypothetical protein ACRELG_25175 [Gemmataceae bacterium]